MSTLFREFASSTSKGRTAQVTHMCLICGARKISTVEVNDFNERAYRKEYPGAHGYTGFSAFRHSECVASGKRDYDFLDNKKTVERDLAHEADIRAEMKTQLSFEEADTDLDFDAEIFSQA